MRHVLDKEELFRRLVVGALRQFCTDCKINDEPIIAIDGRLLVTVQTGEIYELAVHEINIDNVSNDILKEIRDIQPYSSAVSFTEHSLGTFSLGTEEINTEDDATIRLCCESVVEQNAVQIHQNYNVETSMASDSSDKAVPLQTSVLQLPLQSFVLVPMGNDFMTETGIRLSFLGDESSTPDPNQLTGLGDLSDVVSNVDESFASLRTLYTSADTVENSDVSNIGLSTTNAQSSAKRVKEFRSKKAQDRQPRRSKAARRGVKVVLRNNLRQEMTSFIGCGPKQDLKLRRLSALNRLDAHDKQHAKSAYVCYLCNKSARTVLGIRRHLLEEHADVMAGGPAVVCKRAEQSTVGRRKLRERATNLTCHECGGLSFDSHKLYQRHRKLNHYKQRCGLCQIQVDGRVALREHVATHHPGVPVYKASNRFICEFCSFVSGADWLLRDHINTVHFGAVHRCDECGKTLGSALTLRIHCRQLHDANYRHTCEACGMQFSRGVALRDHLRSSHPHLLTDEQFRQMAELTCADCGSSFTRRSALRQHVQLKHTSLRLSHTCSDCGRCFTMLRYLRSHQRKHHCLQDLGNR